MMIDYLGIMMFAIAVTMVFMTKWSAMKKLSVIWGFMSYAVFLGILLLSGNGYIGFGSVSIIFAFLSFWYARHDPEQWWHYPLLICLPNIIVFLSGIVQYLIFVVMKEIPFSMRFLLANTLSIVGVLTIALLAGYLGIRLRYHTQHN